MRSFLSTCSDALGEPHRLLDVAVGQRRDRKARRAIRGLLRIGAQRRAVIGRGRGGVALLAGMAGGEIVAGRRDARRVRCGGRRLAPAQAAAAACGDRPTAVAATSQRGCDQGRQRHVGDLRSAAPANRPRRLDREWPFCGCRRKDSRSRVTMALLRPAAAMTAAYRAAGMRRPRRTLTYSDSSARRRLPAAPR